MAKPKPTVDQYSIRYVAFVDILGFSDIVVRNAGPEMTEQRLALVKTLHEIGNRELDKEYGEDFRFQQFSDSMIISDKATRTGLFNLLDAIAGLGRDLLANGFLIRGGIAKGYLHHDDQVVFGPAFLEAYQIETTIAEYPRVVLSAQTYVDFRNLVKERGTRKEIQALGDSEWLKDLIKLDDDGPAFVHILRGLSDDDLLSDWNAIASTITRLLSEAMHDPRRYKKLKWIAVYWNSTAMDTKRTKISLDRNYA
jgi:hypothetical protein